MPIAPPIDQDTGAEQRGRPAPAFGAQIAAPQFEPIPHMNFGEVRGIEQLGQVLHLPKAPGEAVTPEPMKVNEMDLTLPARDLSRALAWDIKMAQVKVFMEIAACMQRAGQA